MTKTFIAIAFVVGLLGLALVLNMQRGGLAAGLQDGTFIGESELDANNQFGRTELVIEDGQISEVEYTEFDSDHNPKGEDYPYQLAIEAIPQFEQQLVETQNPEQVDNISGATTTWNKFKKSARAAMDQAN